MIAVKKYAVGRAALQARSCERARAWRGCSGARPGARPISVQPAGSGPCGQPWRAHPSKVGRKGDEERPRPSPGVCVRGSGGPGKGTHPGPPTTRGGRASGVPARGAFRNNTVRGAGEGPGGGRGRAPGFPGVGGACGLGPGVFASSFWWGPRSLHTPHPPRPPAGLSSASRIFSRPQAWRSLGLDPSVSRLRKKAAV